MSKKSLQIDKICAYMHRLKVLSLKAKCFTCHKLRAPHQHMPCQTHLYELKTLLCHTSTPDSNTSTLGTTLAMEHHHRLQSTFNTILTAMSLFFFLFFLVLDLILYILKDRKGVNTYKLKLVIKSNCTITS